ncbi:hypothetical protein ABI59_20485 [Acidobacteria bacterium Mor1]|nr:hypothetical protein ABI59_20485 [Acidobacteria bacterium Mor1]
MQQRATLPAILVALWALASPLFAGGAPADPHGDWARALGTHVDEQGLVDYIGLAEDREALDRYLAFVHRVSPDSAPDAFPTRDHELAHYLNAYNALVFEGVLGLEPGIDTVWGNGDGAGFFSNMPVLVGGTKTNLQDLENKIIREQYRDPRIHAALNCASMGCPRLPMEPFRGETLDAQLDAAIREFVNDPRHVGFDAAAGTVRLSKIFDWFAGDFIADQERNGHPDRTALGYINRYRAAGSEIPANARVEIPAYDKRLNQQGTPF